MSYRLLRFWKPYHVLTQFTDAEGRSTLADYIDVPAVYAAGRLDYDSEGLLLLTDNARLKTYLTDPRYHHPRTYWVQVEGQPEASALAQLAQGVVLKDGPTRPANVSILPEPPAIPDRPVPIRVRQHIPTTWLCITLTEGRNRQVRRMTAAVGHPTLRLVRAAIGPLTLAGLHPGQWELLTPTACDQLWASIKQAANSPSPKGRHPR